MSVQIGSSDEYKDLYCHILFSYLFSVGGLMARRPRTLLPGQKFAKKRRARPERRQDPGLAICMGVPNPELLDAAERNLRGA